MSFSDNFKRNLFSISKDTFESKALSLFYYQAENNKVYQEYIKNLGVNPQHVRKLTQIPFLPISFFKTHRVVTDEWQPEIVFESSGTTGQVTSKHYVKQLEFYLKVTEQAFKMFYGQVEDYCFLSLLPSYLERGNSSLVSMMQHFTEKSRYKESGFFLHDDQALKHTIREFSGDKAKLFLVGVSFALVDLAVGFGIDADGMVIMETGGMKGRKKEIIREELHEILKKGFGVSQIHSEYGMTELLSQAYAKADGVFYSPPWMNVRFRDISDPLSVYSDSNRSGGINIIDLANVDSCAFIETQDIGKGVDGQGFMVMGRFDASDIRGCNLMIAG
jgi:hypothetical protein